MAQEYIPFVGGLMTETAGQLLPKGAAIFAENYEHLLDGGYRRIDGYNRWDGRQRIPSATYAWLYYEDVANLQQLLVARGALTSPDIVYGVSSGWGAIVIADAELITGSWGAAGTAKVRVTGYDWPIVSPSLGEVLAVYQDDLTGHIALIDATFGLMDAGPLGGVLDNTVVADPDHSTMLADSITYQRIASGKLYGIQNVQASLFMNGTLFALRDAWCLTVNTWTGGTLEPSIFKIRGQTSGAEATIRGHFQVGQATQYLVLGEASDITGTFQVETLDLIDWDGTLNTAGVGAASAAQSTLKVLWVGAKNTDSTQRPYIDRAWLPHPHQPARVAYVPGTGSPSLPALFPGAPDVQPITRLIAHNFGGHAGSTKMYWVDGENKAIEFDGTLVDGTGFAEITTGMTTDIPLHLEAHKNQLFLLFQGGSVQHSAIADPLTWNVIVGAGEITVGAEATAIESIKGETLLILTNGTSHILYGSDAETWQLTELSQSGGGLPDTLAVLGEPLYLDERGVLTLQASATYGDFEAATISRKVQSWLQAKIPLATCGTRSKKKNQYRLFFNDRFGLYFTMGQEGVVGAMPVYFRNSVYGAWSGLDADGADITLLSMDTDYLMILDEGDTFDGVGIISTLITAFSSQRMPLRVKRYQRATFDGVFVTGHLLATEWWFNYGDTNVRQPTAEDVYLDIAVSDDLVDSARFGLLLADQPNVKVSEGIMAIRGRGRNVAAAIIQKAGVQDSHTIFGVNIEYETTGRFRR